MGDVEMTAYELADAIENWETGANYTLSIKAGQMLRQQADRIAELEKEKIRAYDNGYEDGRKPDTKPCEPLCKPTVCNCTKEKK
jgi:hypothetical protein